MWTKRTLLRFLIGVLSPKAPYIFLLIGCPISGVGIAFVMLIEGHVRNWTSARVVIVREHRLACVNVTTSKCAMAIARLIEELVY